MKQIFETILIKREGKLEHTIKAKEKILNDIIKDLPEGIKIEVFANTMSEKGSNAQLAKIHAMLKQLAHDIGTLKDQIKEQSMVMKSFADCDVNELNGVIQTILKVGDLVGTNLR